MKMSGIVNATSMPVLSKGDVLNKILIDVDIPKDEDNSQKKFEHLIEDIKRGPYETSNNGNKREKNVSTLAEEREKSQADDLFNEIMSDFF